MKSEHRDYVKRRLKEITEGIVHSMRGSCSIEIEESYPCLYNDDSMTALLMNSADDVIGSHNINILEKPSMGVESFAYFAMERPSVFITWVQPMHKKAQIILHMEATLI